MSTNLSLGPIQCHDNSIFSINAALMELQERIDHLKGLRGRSEVWDRVRIESPTVNTDAVDLGSLTDREALFHLTFLMAGTNGLVAYQPGTTYTELSSQLRQQVNLSVPIGLQARLVVSGFGTQSGNGKGVAMADDSGNTLCEVTWNGSAEGVQVGTFTSITLATDVLTRLYVKGSAADESLVLRHVAAEFRFEGGSTVST